MEKRIPTVEDFAKDFLHIIKDCKECGGVGNKINISVKDNLASPDKAVACECVKRVSKYVAYKKANIPVEYFDLNIEKDFGNNTDGEKVKKFFNLIKGDVSQLLGSNLYLYGTQGSGKTFLAVEILKLALQQHKSAYYDSLPFIIDIFIQKGFQADIEKAKYNKIFESKEFLVIDDLGAEEDMYKLVASKVLELNILKKRIGKTTILICKGDNDMDYLGSRYNPSVKSLANNFNSIKFSDKTYRKSSRPMDNTINNIFG